MRTLTSVFSILALTFALGCSGGDDDDDGGNTPDAGSSADAAPSGPDAMPSNPPITSGLGEICQTADNACTVQTQGCLTFVQGATSGVCTSTCATGVADGQQPDAAAQQICVDAYTGTTGTPLCAAIIAQNGGTSDFACLIACGDINGNDAGGCPGGLTCTDNSCQP